MQPPIGHLVRGRLQALQRRVSDVARHDLLGGHALLDQIVAPGLGFRVTVARLFRAHGDHQVRATLIPQQRRVVQALLEQGRRVPSYCAAPSTTIASTWSIRDESSW